MRQATLISVFLGAIAVCIPANAHGKLPPGTTFEACGASGCATAAGGDALDSSVRLLEPTVEHGDVGAPAGSAEWFRVEMALPPRSDRTGGSSLRAIERRFPVVFAPDGASLGIPESSRSYRWVSMRPAAMKAYAELAEAVEPFPKRDLSDLDPRAVAREGGDAATARDEDRWVVLPALLVGLGGVAVPLVRALRA